MSVLKVTLGEFLYCMQSDGYEIILVGTDVSNDWMHLKDAFACHLKLYDGPHKIKVQEYLRIMRDAGEKVSVSEFPQEISYSNNDINNPLDSANLDDDDIMIFKVLQKFIICETIPCERKVYVYFKGVIKPIEIGYDDYYGKHTVI